MTVATDNMADASLTLVYGAAQQMVSLYQASEVGSVLKGISLHDAITAHIMVGNAGSCYVVTITLFQDTQLDSWGPHPQ